MDEIDIRGELVALTDDEWTELERAISTERTYCMADIMNGIGRVLGIGHVSARDLADVTRQVIGRARARAYLRCASCEYGGLA